MGVNTFFSRAGGMLFWAASASLLCCMSCAQSNSPASPATTQTVRFRADMANPWRPLNDGVMGGLSEGDVVMHDTAMSWKGQTRLVQRPNDFAKQCIDLCFTFFDAHKKAKRFCNTHHQWDEKKAEYKSE